MSATRRHRLAGRPSRRPPSGGPRIEHLDGRTLPSGFGLGLGLGSRPGVLVLAPAPGGAPVSDHNPLREHIASGLVLKKFPHFYGAYTGPQLPGLSARSATAHLVPGSGFVFTGTMAGPIDPTLTASYVFGIDRGGAAAPGPFAKRAGIFYDATVAVTTGPDGAGAVVTLINANGQNPQAVLPPEAVSVSGNTVSVTVDPSLLPPTSTPRTRLKLTEYRFALWTELGTTDNGQVADFIPEYSLARFALPRR